MTPDARKSHRIRTRPEGVKTRGKKSVAFLKTSRINQRRSRKTRRISLSNAAKRQKAAEVNARREQTAIKKGNVKAKVSTVQVSPARTVEVSPAKTTTRQVKKYTPVEVRAGSSKSFGKERPKGVSAPSPEKSPLQRKLTIARSKEQDLVTHQDRIYRAGTTSTSTVSKTTPAVTRQLPAITKKVTTPQVEFKRKVPKLKKRQAGGFAVSSNARVKKVRIK